MFWTAFYLKKCKVLRPRDVTQRPFWRSKRHLQLAYQVIFGNFAASGELKSLWPYKQRQLLTNTDVSYGRAHALSVELLIVSHSCSVSVLLSVKSYLTLLPYVTERQGLIPGIEPDSQHANTGQRFTSHSLSAKQHFRYIYIYLYISVCLSTCIHLSNMLHHWQEHYNLFQNETHATTHLNTHI